MKIHSDSLCRPLSRPRLPGRRGFSLVELLVVILILSIIFVIGGSQISRAWKRQKLESAANDVRVIFQRALPEMQRRGMVTFLQVGPFTTVGASQFLPIYLVGDANQTGALDGFARTPTVALPDVLIDEYDITVAGGNIDQEFCLSEDGANLIKSTLWSNNATAYTAARVLMCDFQGRAIDVATGRQIAGPATMVFTHVDVVTGNFQTPMRFLLTVNPVWSIRSIRQINSSYTRPYAAATWVDQNG